METPSSPPETIPANKREELHQILVDLVASVYFQPPESLKLTYPCIVYKRDTIKSTFADNQKYANSTRYQVTVIDPDPDGDLVNVVNALPQCIHARNFIHAGLNHDVFELYY